jgi:hypothetical protein
MFRYLQVRYEGFYAFFPGRRAAEDVFSVTAARMSAYNAF